MGLIEETFSCFKNQKSTTHIITCLLKHAFNQKFDPVRKIPFFEISLVYLRYIPTKFINSFDQMQIMPDRVIKNYTLIDSFKILIFNLLYKTDIRFEIKDKWGCYVTGCMLMN